MVWGHLFLLKTLQVLYLFFSERKDELEGEIFEILLTFSDFVSFKDMFLDYRAVSINPFKMN